MVVFRVIKLQNESLDNSLDNILRFQKHVARPFPVSAASKFHFQRLEVTDGLPLCAARLVVRPCTALPRVLKRYLDNTNV